MSHHFEELRENVITCELRTTVDLREVLAVGVGHLWRGAAATRLRVSVFRARDPTEWSRAQQVKFVESVEKELESVVFSAILADQS